MSLLRVSRQLYAPISRICAPRSINYTRTFASTFIRQNSSTSSTPQASQDISLAAQVYPIDQEAITEEDVDSWLQAVHELKTGKTNAETKQEIYLQQLVNPEPFLKEETQFVPTQEQLAEVASFESIKVPLLSDPLVDNMVNLIMRHDPLEVLYETIDKLAPLTDTKTQKTGTAKNKTVPYPLTTRQRNKYAIVWILEGARNKKSPTLSVRLAEEILSAYDGKSAGYAKKAQMHKLAVSQRATVRI
ncbi:hypothetical protein QCA50_016788 [Cerrena zonata]|uniref:Small ribosomal subunit protein uS7 domain-containing protein n=1 Tax=Cerrena zonata TaxID=2478898 RepID=A0AAW0FEF9_9APHY